MFSIEFILILKIPSNYFIPENVGKDFLVGFIYSRFTQIVGLGLSSFFLFNKDLEAYVTKYNFFGE